MGMGMAMVNDRRANGLQRWLRGLAVCLAVAAALTLASVTPARAQADAAAAESEARDSFARGRAAYDAGEFDTAAQSFERAYALSGKSGLLYNLYLAYRDANRQQQAADALRAYLEKDTQVPNRGQLEARLKAIDAGIRERELAAAEEARRASAPAPAPAAPVAAPTPVRIEESPREARRWWLRPVAVMGAGGVLMLASVIPGVMALHKANELDSKCMDGVCSDTLRSVDRQRKTLAVTSDVMLFGGVATAAAGAVWLLINRSARREQTPVSAACTPHGCAATYTSQF